MRDLTLFTLVLDDSSSEQSKKLHNKCISTWDKLITYFKERDINVNIKLYTKDDEEYKAVRELIVQDDLPLSHIADIFRMYILSTKPNYMWLDWDVWVPNNFVLLFDYDKKIFRKSYWVLYNANELEFYAKIFNCIIDNQLSRLNDRSISKYLLENNIITENDITNGGLPFYHMQGVDNREPEDLIFVDRIDESDERYIELAEWKNNGAIGSKPNRLYYYTKYKDSNSIAKVIYGENDIIEFILENYDLSQEQKEVLNNWLSETIQ